MLDWQKHKKLRLFIKTICIVLIISFLSYDLSWAGATEVLNPKNWYNPQERQLQSVEIPSELGTIKESYISKYNPYKLVIHIQDAHANVEAQENEAKLIKHLKDKYKVNLVSVEGGFGDFDAEFFRSFPKDKKVRDKIAKYFLSKAFISGTDYLLITEDEPPFVYGAEDKELYTAHLNTFKDNQVTADSLNRSLGTLESVIETLKDRYYTKDLKELDAKINDFRQGRISLEEYLSYLNITSIINNFDLSKFPNLYSLVTSQELEHKINFAKAESERGDLIDSLTKALSKQDLEELVKNSLDFKANKLTPAEYYAYLEKLTKEAGIQVNTYNNLFTYIKYITLSENLDNSKVFDEIDEFTQRLKEKLAVTTVQKDIDNLTYIIRILKGLSDISLSPKEYEYFKKTREDFNQRRLAWLFKRYIDSSYLKSLPTDEEIASLEKFYSLAHDRDKAIVSNSLNRLNREYSTNSVILVAGGFHTQGITSILKEKDISYIVVAPNIKQSQDKETTYFALLKDKKLPLQDVLNDPDTLQIINSISDSEARQLLITYWVARASRYYSFNELQAQLNRLELSDGDHGAVETALREISPEVKLAKEEKIPSSYKEEEQGGITAGKEELSSAPLPAQNKKSSSPVVENIQKQESIINPKVIIPKGPTLLERFTGFIGSLKPKPKEEVVVTKIETVPTSHTEVKEPLEGIAAGRQEQKSSVPAPRITNLTSYKSMQYNQKGFILPELLVALGGLGLIGLSTPLFISGNMILGGLTAILGILIFVTIILKPFLPQIKNFVRSKLTIGTISLGLLLSIIFGNPNPSSQNLAPIISHGNIPNVQIVSREYAKQTTPILLPFYTQTEIRKQGSTYSLYINREWSPAIFGMVYQPVPEGRHINEYRGNMSELYRSLLDKSEGGKGHASTLHNLGIKTIRIYDISVDDAKEIKQIFRKVYQDYGIRVYIGSFAGLYENRDYQNQRERQKIIDNVLKVVNTYRDEPWLLGWQIGNEGNYHVVGGKLGQRINLTLSEYYSFMDEIAGAVKQRLNDDLRQQIIILGNGDLTEEEASLISYMQNIDAVGINCFRVKDGVIDLLKLAKERISKPIIISEIGLPAKTSAEQQAQSQYFKDVISLLDENSIGRKGLGNIVMAFICEATDEQWKAIDSTKPEEAYLGVLGKDSQEAVKSLLWKIERMNKFVIPPLGIESEDLIKSAWQALEVKNYGLAIRYATDCIRFWAEEAQKQQQRCVEMGKFPATAMVKVGTKEFSGKIYDIYTREVYSFWALNDVGAAYHIIGKAQFEQGRQQEANFAFNEILNNYSYAQVQMEGKMPPVRLIIMGRNGILSRVFDLVEQGKVPDEVGYFKIKDMVLGKENKSSPHSLSSEDLTHAAWQFLANQDYGSAVAYADKCIELYQEKAQEQQNTALSLRKPPKTERDIWQYWALNDVGTSYFIKLRAVYEQGDKRQAREIYDELVKNYNRAQVRDLEGNYWTLKNAVRRLYPDLLPGLISIDKGKAALYALGVLVLITIRSIIGSLRSFGASILNFLGLKQKAKGSKTPHVENVPVMSKKDKITFLTLVFGELYLLFNFVAWWFHPIRMEYYIVSFPLFGFLSYLGACGIIFYLYVWHLVWSMQKPKYMAPPTGLKVAMATTFIESEPIELVKETLLKMKQVRYPHDTFVLDESNNPQLAAFCQQNGMIHFTRKGNAKYHQPQPPFQAKTKGGNLNAWLDTHGSKYEFVTFLDPDHQPESIFLDRILGYFNDPKVGFVQAPHVYKNADESWIARGGAEQNHYFVGLIQRGLHGNDAAVANGSHSSFRIKALQSIGGYGVHNADDMLTSLRLHAKGWRGVFVPEVLAEGLTPATWGPYLQQQYRWSNSMFDMFFFRYPGQFLHLKLRQILGYLMLGSWYFLQVNLLLLMLLPIISVAINQSPVNLELVNFLKYFMPFYLSQMLILIGWSQKFLLKPQIEKGVWWRGGMLWVASSIYITYSFIRAIFKQGLLRTKFVTPKTTETGVSYLRLFVPHIILVGISVLTLGYTYFLDSYLWPTRGMKLFLIMSIASLTGLIITSTKWFSNWYTNRISKTKSPPQHPNKIDTKLLESVLKINFYQREHFVEKIKKALGGSVKGKTIAVLGLAFKPNTDDMREAPSITIIQMLHELGARVKVYDPIAIENAKKEFKGMDIIYAESAYEAIKGADLLAIVTEWEEFRNLDLVKVRSLLKAPIIVDGRNIFKPQEMKRLGIKYIGTGRLGPDDEFEELLKKIEIIKLKESKESRSKAEELLKQGEIDEAEAIYREVMDKQKLDLEEIIADLTNLYFNGIEAAKVLAQRLGLNLKKGRIIVTGGAGFLGAHMIEKLLKEGYQVVTIDSLKGDNRDRLTVFEANPNFQFIQYDITQSVEVEGRIDCIFHFASVASPKLAEEMPEEAWRVNTIGTENILEIARKKNAKIIYASSAEIYGEPPLEFYPQKEEYKGYTNPVGIKAPFVEPQRTAEALVSTLYRTYGVDACIARIFSTIGEDMDLDNGYMVSTILGDILKGKETIRIPNRRGKLNFVFVDDVIDALFGLMVHKFEDLEETPEERMEKRIFNIGNPQTIEFKDVIELIRKRTNRDLRLDDDKPAYADISFLQPDIERVASVLGWQPQISIQDALSRTINGILNHYQKNSPMNTGIQRESEYLKDKLVQFREKESLPLNVIKPKLPTTRHKGRVVITGGAGFLGSNMARRLLEEGYQVIVVDDLSAGREVNIKNLEDNPDFQFVNFDITQPFTIEGDIDFVLHFASLASPEFYYKKPLETLHSGIQGMEGALKLTKEKNARFVFTSTSEIYGDPLEHPQTEGYFGNVSPIGKRSQYDQSKRSAETLAKIYLEKYGVDIRIVRLFNSFGVNMRPDDGRVITNFIRQALEGRPLTVYGEGTQTRSLCYVDDTIEGLLKLMEYDKFTKDTSIQDRIFNIGSDREEITMIELAEVVQGFIKEITNRDVQIIKVSQPDKYDPTRRNPDITKARTVLNWQPKVPMKEGILKTIEYFLTLPEYRNIVVQSLPKQISQAAREGDLQLLNEAEGIASKVFDPFGKVMFARDEKENFTVNPKVIQLIRDIISKEGQLAIEIDIDTLIDTSRGYSQLKGYGFKEAVLALYESQQKKDIPQGLHIRLISLNPQLNKVKIIKALGLTEELLGEFVSIPDIPEDYLIKGVEFYLIEGSIRIVFEDNVKYWGKKIDVLVKRGKESEVLSSLGLIVAALAKDPKFYQELPQELKDYIVGVTDEKGNIALDDQQKIKQLIFKPIEKEKLDSEYLEELNRTNKVLEGMV